MANSGTTAFPATLDSFLGLGTARKEDEAGYTHVALHNQDQAAITALEKVVGTCAGTGVLTNFSAGDIAARTNNETFGTPDITGGTADSFTLGTPAISAGTTSGVINKPTLTTDTDGATITFDMNVSGLHTVVLGGNRTLAVSNTAVGQPFIIRLKQDATGSRTVTWFSTINWKDDIVPTLGTAVSNVDVYGFLCTATNTYDGYVAGEGIDES